jgi:hypothetical protein
VVDSDIRQQVLVDYALWRMGPQTVASNRRQLAMIWLTCVAASDPGADSRQDPHTANRVQSISQVKATDAVD